jgi:hypothetical protein
VGFETTIIVLYLSSFIPRHTLVYTVKVSLHGFRYDKQETCIHVTFNCLPVIKSVSLPLWASPVWIWTHIRCELSNQFTCQIPNSSDTASTYRRRCWSRRSSRRIQFHSHSWASGSDVALSLHSALSIHHCTLEQNPPNGSIMLNLVVRQMDSLWYQLISDRRIQVRN